MQISATPPASAPAADATKPSSATHVSDGYVQVHWREPGDDGVRREGYVTIGASDDAGRNWANLVEYAPRWLRDDKKTILASEKPLITADPAVSDAVRQIIDGVKGTSLAHVPSQEYFSSTRDEDGKAVRDLAMIVHVDEQWNQKVYQMPLSTAPQAVRDVIDAAKAVVASLPEAR